MPGRILLLGDIDGHAATVIANLLTGWEVRSLPWDRITRHTLPPEEQGKVGLVVLQSRSENEAEIVRWCKEVKANTHLAGAKLLVALDPDLAGQYAATRAAGADECLMVPASAGHVEKMLRSLLGESFPEG